MSYHVGYIMEIRAEIIPFKLFSTEALVLWPALRSPVYFASHAKGI